MALMSYATGAALMLAGVQSVPRPTFDAASIKANKSTTGVMGGACQGTDPAPSTGRAGLLDMARASVQFAPIPPGTCRMVRASLKMLIQEAYGLVLDQN